MPNTSPLNKNSNKYAKEVQFDTPYWELLSILTSHNEVDVVIKGIESIEALVDFKKEAGKLLICACIEDQPDLIEYLLQHDADPETLSLHNTTPIMYAAQNGNLEIVKHFIDINIDPFKTYNIINIRDTTPVAQISGILKYAQDNVKEFLIQYMYKIMQNDKECDTVKHTDDTSVILTNYKEQIAKLEVTITELKKKQDIIEPHIINLNNKVIMSLWKLIDNKKVVAILQHNYEIIDKLSSIITGDLEQSREIQYAQQNVTAHEIINTVYYVYQHSIIDDAYFKKKYTSKLLVELLILIHFNNISSQSHVSDKCNTTDEASVSVMRNIRFTENRIYFDNINTSILFDVTSTGVHPLESFNMKQCVIDPDLLVNKETDQIKILLTNFEYYELFHKQFDTLYY
jgi:hypothetical protein